MCVWGAAGVSGHGHACVGLATNPALLLLQPLPPHLLLLLLLLLPCRRRPPRRQGIRTLSPRASGGGSPSATGRSSLMLCARGAESGLGKWEIRYAGGR
jgi:hypothetical protein